MPKMFGLVFKKKVPPYLLMYSFFLFILNPAFSRYNYMNERKFQICISGQLIKAGRTDCGQL